MYLYTHAHTHIHLSYVDIEALNVIFYVAHFWNYIFFYCCCCCCSFHSSKYFKTLRWWCHALILTFIVCVCVLREYGHKHTSAWAHWSSKWLLFVNKIVEIHNIICSLLLLLFLLFLLHTTMKCVSLVSISLCVCHCELLWSFSDTQIVELKYKFFERNHIWK